MIICLGCMNELQENLKFCPICGYRNGQPAAEPYFLNPGTVLNNRYVVGKSIGNGGFGITYIGYDLVLSRKCAIKEYFPRILANRTVGTAHVSAFRGEDEGQFRIGLSSFIAEARKLAEFANIPQIVNVYDCFQTNGTGYIVMEFISGYTVADRLRDQGRYSYEEARDIIIEVLRGLIPVHKAQMVHRDISPDNIMITENQQVKLIDFGAARQVIADKSLNYSVILKPGYAPVEQYSTNGVQGPWTDIYAVGSTFYRMITGQKPPISLDRVTRDELVLPSALGVDIPPYAEKLIQAALAVQWENRIQSSEKFLAALAEERTITISAPREETIGAGDIVKYILGFVAVTLLTGALVCFVLELVINKKNIIYEMIGQKYMEENAALDLPEEPEEKWELLVEPEVIREDV